MFKMFQCLCVWLRSKVPLPYLLTRISIMDMLHMKEPNEGLPLIRKIFNLDLQIAEKPLKLHVRLSRTIG
jgi:hypothetical protein